MQLFETGDGVLAVDVWLLGACGRCLTQTRLPARRTRNRWCWKMRHLSEALKPPPTTLPTLLPLLHTLCFSLLLSLSSIKELFFCLFFLPRLFKSTCYCLHKCHVFKKKSSSKLLGDEDVCHLFLIAGTQGAVGHLPV